WSAAAQEAWSGALAGVALEPLAAPAGEGPFENPAPRLRRQPDEEAHVVDRHEPESQHFSRHEEMPDVGARKPGAGLAVASRIQRRVREPVAGRLDVDAAAGGPRRAVPPVPGGSDAVEKVHAAGNSL